MDEATETPAGSQIPDLQRRRDGARHFQGPPAAGVRPAPADRGHDPVPPTPCRRMWPTSSSARSTTRRRRLLREAIAACYEKGYLGNNILGSDYSLEMHVHASAGRYICGEETALISSLEGKRANPRAKPPFPQVSGLWGRPTIVNNVETLCNVHHIIERGADWFQSLGLTEDAGTKMYGVSGRVKNPGCWELPIGTPVREIHRRLRRRHGRRLPAARLPARRRLHGFSHRASTWTWPWTTTPSARRAAAWAPAP